MHIYTTGTTVVDVVDQRMLFSGVKVFSATLAEDRDKLGEKVTAWLSANRDKLLVVDQVVLQSSDAAFHCLTIILFYQHS